jgi:hypothetical protein
VTDPTDGTDERGNAIVRRPTGSSELVPSRRARAPRTLSPRAAKRVVERTIRQSPQADRTVAPSSRTAHGPAVAALSIVALMGVGIVFGLPTPPPAESATSDPVALAAETAEPQVLDGTVLADPIRVPTYDTTVKEAPEPDPIVTPVYAAGGGSYTTNANWPIQWPIQFTAPISAWFGYDPGRGRTHYGLDITPGSGIPIVAIADGVVQSPPGWPALGNHILIYYPELGVYSLYAHMIAPAIVSPGAKVVAGQQVGNVGSTGLSTGAHLHFEIHDGGGTPIDPYAWMKEHAGP